MRPLDYAKLLATIEQLYQSEKMDPAAVQDEHSAIRFFEAQLAYACLHADLERLQDERDPNNAFNILKNLIAARWARIQFSDFTYNNDTHNPANLVYIQVAKELIAAMENPLPLYLLLMPTLVVDPLDDLGIGKSLDDLLLHEFILSDDCTRHIELWPTIDLAKRESTLRYYRNQAWLDLSASEQARLLDHMPEAKICFELIVQLKNAEEMGSIGKNLKDLRIALQAGSTQVAGSDAEMNAAEAANVGLQKFYVYYSTLAPSLQNRLKACKSKDGVQSFAQIWGLLARDKDSNYKSVTYCLNTLGGQLELVIDNNQQLFVSLVQDLNEILATAMDDLQIALERKIHPARRSTLNPNGSAIAWESLTANLPATTLLAQMTEFPLNAKQLTTHQQVQLFKLLPFKSCIPFLIKNISIAKNLFAEKTFSNRDIIDNLPILIDNNFLALLVQKRGLEALLINLGELSPTLLLIYFKNFKAQSVEPYNQTLLAAIIEYDLLPQFFRHLDSKLSKWLVKQPANNLTDILNNPACVKIIVSQLSVSQIQILLAEHPLGQVCRTRYEISVTATCALDQHHYALGAYNGKILICNAQTNLTLREIVAGNSKISALSILSNDCLISGDHNGFVKIWNWTTGTLIRTLDGHCTTITSLLPLEGVLVSSAVNNEIVKWDLKNGEQLQNAQWPISTPYLHTLRDGTILVAQSTWLSILKAPDYNIADESRLLGHNDTVTCVAELPNQRLVSGSMDTCVRIWDLETNQCTSVLAGHESSILAIKTLPNTDIVSIALDGVCKIWNSLTGDCIQTLCAPLPNGRIDTVANNKLFYLSEKNDVITLSSPPFHLLLKQLLRKVEITHIPHGFIVLMMELGEMEVIFQLVLPGRWIDYLMAHPSLHNAIVNSPVCQQLFIQYFNQADLLQLLIKSSYRKVLLQSDAKFCRTYLVTACEDYKMYCATLTEKIIEFGLLYDLLKHVKNKLNRWLTSLPVNLVDKIFQAQNSPLILLSHLTSPQLLNFLPSISQKRTLRLYVEGALADPKIVNICKQFIDLIIKAECFDMICSRLIVRPNLLQDEAYLAIFQDKVCMDQLVAYLHKEEIMNHIRQFPLELRRQLMMSDARAALIFLNHANFADSVVVNGAVTLKMLEFNLLETLISCMEKCLVPWLVHLPHEITLQIMTSHHVMPIILAKPSITEMTALVQSLQAKATPTEKIQLQRMVRAYVTRFRDTDNAELYLDLICQIRVTDELWKNDALCDALFAKLPSQRIEDLLLHHKPLAKDQIRKLFTGYIKVLDQNVVLTMQNAVLLLMLENDQLPILIAKIPGCINQWLHAQTITTRTLILHRAQYIEGFVKKLTAEELSILISTCRLSTESASALIIKILSAHQEGLLPNTLIKLCIQYKLFSIIMQTTDKSRLLNSILALPLPITTQLLSDPSSVTALVDYLNDNDLVILATKLNNAMQIPFMLCHPKLCELTLRQGPKQNESVFTQSVVSNIIGHGHLNVLLIHLGNKLNDWLTQTSILHQRTALTTPNCADALLQFLTIDQLIYWITHIQAQTPLPQKNNFKPLFRQFLILRTTDNTATQVMNLIYITQAQSELWKNDPACNHLFADLSMHELAQFADYCIHYNKTELQSDATDRALFAKKISMGLLNTVDTAKAHSVPLVLLTLLMESNLLPLFLLKLRDKVESYFMNLPLADLTSLLKHKEHKGILVNCLDPKLLKALWAKAFPSLFTSIGNFFQTPQPAPSIGQTSPSMEQGFQDRP